MPIHRLRFHGGFYRSAIVVNETLKAEMAKLAVSHESCGQTVRLRHM